MKSKNISLNGKQMTSDEALDRLDAMEANDELVTEVSISFEGNKDNSSLPTNDDGFEIRQDIIAGMAKKLDECDAGIIKLEISGSRFLGRKNLTVAICPPEYEVKAFSYNPKKLNVLQKTILKLIDKNF